MHLNPHPCSLGCSPLSGGSSVFVDLLSCVHLIVCRILCWYALLYVLTKFAIILTRKRQLPALLSDILLLYFFVALPHGAVG